MHLLKKWDFIIILFLCQSSTKFDKFKKINIKIVFTYFIMQNIFSLNCLGLAFEFLDLNFTHIYYVPSQNGQYESKTMIYLPLKDKIGNNECIHSNFFNHILDAIFEYYQTLIDLTNTDEHILIYLEYKGFKQAILVKLIETTSYDFFTFTPFNPHDSFEEFKQSLLEKEKLDALFEPDEGEKNKSKKTKI